MQPNSIPMTGCRKKKKTSTRHQETLEVQDSSGYEECLREMVHSLLHQLCPIACDLEPCPITCDKRLSERRKVLEEKLLLQVSEMVTRSPEEVIFLQNLRTAGKLPLCGLVSMVVTPALRELQETVTIDRRRPVGDLERSPLLQQKVASGLTRRLLPCNKPSVSPSVDFRHALIAQLRY